MSEAIPTGESNIELKTFSFEVITVDEKGVEVKRENAQAQHFREDLGNRVTLELVEIPGGSFMMGTEDKEIERLVQEYNEPDFRTERPQHEVRVPRFFMGRYLVSQEQWRIVAGWEKVKGEVQADPSSYFQKDYEGVERWKRPVVRVSWRDAQEFCARLSKKSKREYRLPTEAEWEYACRALTTTAFHFGETIATELANYRGTDWEIEGKVYLGNYGRGAKGEYRQKTTPVGSFPPNAFGLYDMHGNVMEWCEDNWHDNYNGAPEDGSAWLSTAKYTTKIIRSGSWKDHPEYCRSANREAEDPDYFCDSNIGFRVVCVASRTT